MVLVFIIAILFILIMVLKAKANDDRIKSDTIEFDTQKSVAEITNVLRSFDCQIERLNDDPLDSGPKPEIAVLLMGKPGFKESLKHPGGAVSLWGVQTIVNDLGKRHTFPTS